MFVPPLWLMGLHFKSCVAVVIGGLISEDIFNIVQSSKDKQNYYKKFLQKLTYFSFNLVIMSYQEIWTNLVYLNKQVNFFEGGTQLKTSSEKNLPLLVVGWDALAIRIP